REEEAKNGASDEHRAPVSQHTKRKAPHKRRTLRRKKQPQVMANLELNRNCPPHTAPRGLDSLAHRHSSASFLIICHHSLISASDDQKPEDSWPKKNKMNSKLWKSSPTLQRLAQPDWLDTALTISRKHHHKGESAVPLCACFETAQQPIC